MYDLVVIGRGVSGLSFLHYASQMGQLGKTLLVGRNDLWRNIAASDKSHPFGQPGQIVTLPGNSGSATVKNPTFQNAGDIAAQMVKLEKTLSSQSNVTVMNGDAVSIKRVGPSKFKLGLVEYMDGVNKVERLVEAKRVVLASGFGPSSRPPAKLPDEVEQKGTLPGSCLVMGATEYLHNTVSVPKDSDDFTVVVQGASATASWAVARAMALGAKKIVWVTRDGFSDANPAGRNTHVLEAAIKHGWLVRASVPDVALARGLQSPRLQITLAPVASAPQAEAPRNLSSLALAYKDWYGLANKHSEQSKREQGLAIKFTDIDKITKIYAHHFIYALGANPMLPGGAQAALDPSLRQELRPVFDDHRRFGDVPTDTTIAWATEDQDLWVVGSATFRTVIAKGATDLGASFRNISQLMCEAGSPPEGIAAVLAATKAVTGVYEDAIGSINLQTADFKEIERWLAKLYALRTGQQIPRRTAAVVTDQIVALRKHTVFGLSEAEIKGLMDPDSQFWNEMFSKRRPEERYPLDEIAANTARY